MAWIQTILQWPSRRLEHAFYLLLTLVAVFGINPYLYGLYNHCVTVPFVFEAADPSLYPGDPMVQEIDYFYTWFLQGMGGLYRLLGLPLETLFFVLHLVAVYATFWSFFHLAKTLSGRRSAAAVACMLFLFGTKTIGYVGTFESHLMERTLIMPLEFLALAWMLRGRWVAAFAATGIAFCIHPLSAFYVGVLTGAAALWSLWQANREGAFSREALRVGLGILVGALAAAPSLYLKAIGPEPLMPMGTPIDGWLDILAMRSAYHVFPFDWPWHGWLRAGMFWAGVCLLRRGIVPTSLDRRVQAAGVAFIGMALLGVVFTEWIPMSIVVQFQFFRAYRFVMYFGMIYLAIGMLRGAEGKVHPGTLIVAFVLAAPAWTEMVGLKYATMAATWLLLLGGVCYGMPRWHWRFSQVLVLALVFPLMVTPASIILRGFNIHSHQESDWVAVQRWAESNTAIDAGFIVPPNRKGFRVDSKRAVYVDWNDGTQTFFNQAFGTAWLERMTQVGFKGTPEGMGAGYRALTPRRFREVADEMPENGTVFAVVFPSMDLPFEEVYANEDYRVLRVR